MVLRTHTKKLFTMTLGVKTIGLAEAANEVLLIY